MKVFIDNLGGKELFFKANGNTELQEFSNRQEEKLEIQFTGTAADVGSVAVVIKATAADTTNIAEQATFSHSAGVHTGWLNLNTDEANALDGDTVFIEVSWTESGHAQKSDPRALKIIKSLVTGTEASPTASVSWWTLLKSKFSNAWFAFNDTTQIIEPVIATQAEAEAGSADTALMTPHRVSQAIAALSSAGAWGSITGNINSQTDLHNALMAKANLIGPEFSGTVTFQSIPTTFSDGDVVVQSTLMNLVLQGLQDHIDATGYIALPDGRRIAVVDA